MAKITLADGMIIEGTAEELRELAEVFGEVAEATEKEVTKDFDLRTKDEALETTEAPREGDYVVSSKSSLGITAGKPYKVTTVHSDGDFTFRDDDDDPRCWNAGSDDVTFYRPIEGAPQVGDKILVTDAVSTGGRCGDGDIIKRAERKPALEVGDKVRLISGGGEPARFGLKDGDICEVTTTNHEGYYPVGINNGSVTGFAFPEQLEKVSDTAEEAAEETIEVGDIVRTDEGTLHEVVCVREPGYIHADDGVTLKDSESPSGIRWKFLRNCEIVAKKADRKDV